MHTCRFCPAVVKGRGDVCTQCNIDKYRSGDSPILPQNAPYVEDESSPDVSDAQHDYHGDSIRDDL